MNRMAQNEWDYNIFNLHNLGHTSKALILNPVLCSISNTCIWNKYLKHTDVLAMFWDMTDLCMKFLKVEWGKPTGSREENNSNVTWFRFRKWWWLYCTQTGSRWQRKMKIERKDGKNLLYTRRILKYFAYFICHIENTLFKNTLCVGRLI